LDLLFPFKYFVFSKKNCFFFGFIISVLNGCSNFFWPAKGLLTFTDVIDQVHPEGKYVVDIDKSIDITKITPSTRVALRNDSYMLHLILPSKVDPLVNLMKVEKVPDSTYDMIGGLDQQIKEIKEVCVEFQCIVLSTHNI
jgi:ATP-dependent 26S proteasome regulatory subunit